MPRRNLQFQHEQAGHVLTPWRRGEVALIAGICDKGMRSSIGICRCGYLSSYLFSSHSFPWLCLTPFSRPMVRGSAAPTRARELDLLDYLPILQDAETTEHREP